MKKKIHAIRYKKFCVLFLPKRMTYVSCVLDDDYEICTDYPYNIRKKSNQKPVKEGEMKIGYIRVYLNGVSYYKHRIIATQFIPNDDPMVKTQVDHINHNRKDYHIRNLRWVSSKENNLNKTSHKGVDYEYIDKDALPDDLIEVREYGEHRFDGYYYSPETDLFYFDNGVKIRKLHTCYKRSGLAYVNMFDKNDDIIQIYYLKFKKIHDLM